MNLKSLLNQCAPVGVEFAAIREIDEKSLFYRTKNSYLDEVEFLDDHGIMVEIIDRGHVAYAATADMSVSGVKKAFAFAKDNLKRGNQKKIYNFLSTKIRPPHFSPKPNQVFDLPNTIESKDIIEKLIDVDQLLKFGPVIQTTSVVMMLNYRHSYYVSTLGAEIHQFNPMMAIDTIAIASDAGKTQKRSTGLKVSQGNWRTIDWESLKNDSMRVGREAQTLLLSPGCPHEKMDLILMPDQLYLQIHESIGHPLELDRILGDERNYAGWSFIRPDQFGSLRYGSSLLNITFDPHVSGELASFEYDDTGAKAKQEFLIKEGILVRGIGGLESQVRSGIPGVSSMRASSWNRPPIDRMANINLLPGESSLKEMIAQTERGILMATNRSWSIDDYRNKFQFGCEFGQLIENGKLTKVVRDPNYRGSTIDFWNSLKAVGNSEELELSGSPYCGKGEPNQTIRVGHACPPCLFSQVQVFGGVE